MGDSAEILKRLEKKSISMHGRGCIIIMRSSFLIATILFRADDGPAGQLRGRRRCLKNAPTQRAFYRLAKARWRT